MTQDTGDCVWGWVGIFHVTILPGQSQENQPNLLTAPSIVHGGQDFPFSHSLSCGPVGDIGGLHPADQDGKDPLPL
jgi:hypothetical protein